MLKNTMRRIFVGSATESVDKARQLCDALSNGTDTECVLWETQFTPGYLTFEALEEMMQQCCGAILLATPDDDVTVRGKAMKVPRANVLLEFGLVAGRLGRPSIAVCRFGEAELPTDLKGLTVIEMDCPEGVSEKEPFSSRAMAQLRSWSSHLVMTPEMIPRTSVFHGYTGRWHFELTLKKWRDRGIQHPSYAQVNGELHLVIPANGQAGSGMTRGQMLFRLMNSEGGRTYQGEFRTSHEIRDAFCHLDGSLEFATQAFGLQIVNEAGDAPPELIGMGMSPEPWSSRWLLRPTSEPRALEGSVVTESSGITEGTVKITKTGEGA